MSAAPSVQTVNPYSPEAVSTIDARSHIAPGTGVRVAIATVGLILSVVLTILITWGIAIILWAIAGLVYFTRINKSRAALHGSAIRVAPDQFPDIHARVLAISQRLGLARPPEVFIVSASQPNAIATRIGRRMYVILFDDVVFGAQQADDPRVLEFILAHEMAHHALGHTDMFRAWLSATLKGLSRRDEFSCDSVAHALIGGDLGASRDALGLLAIGPHLYRYLDPVGLQRQIDATIADKNSRKAEGVFRLSHPLMLRRMARLSQPIKL